MKHMRHRTLLLLLLLLLLFLPKLKTHPAGQGNTVAEGRNSAKIEPKKSLTSLNIPLVKPYVHMAFLLLL